MARIIEIVGFVVVASAIGLGFWLMAKSIALPTVTKNSEKKEDDNE